MTSYDIGCREVLGLPAGRPLLTNLEEAIHYRGRLRWSMRDGIKPHTAYGETQLVAVINKLYGTRLKSQIVALEYMERKVEEEQQAARERAAFYRQAAVA